MFRAYKKAMWPLFVRRNRDLIKPDQKLIALSALDQLDKNDQYIILSRLAQNLNIERFVVQGPAGKFESLSKDLIMLRVYAVEQAWASDIIECITQFFTKKSGGYIDIGANIGFTLIPVANLGVHCYAFEPEPNNFISLRHNIAENAPNTSIELFNFALSDTNGESTLQLSSDNLGDHRLKNPENTIEETELTQRKCITILTKKLDSLDLSVPRPLVVKIDAQGAEPMIIGGGSKTIAQADMLIMEFSPFHMAKFTDNIDDMLKFLEGEFRSIDILHERDAETMNLSKREIVDYLRVFFSKRAVLPETEDSFFDVIARK